MKQHIHQVDKLWIVNFKFSFTLWCQNNLCMVISNWSPWNFFSKKLHSKLRLHRGRKGIFNYFSKFSKLIINQSGLIDQIPEWLYLVVKVSKRAKNSWKKPQITYSLFFKKNCLGKLDTLEIKTFGLGSRTRDVCS